MSRYVNPKWRREGLIWVSDMERPVDAPDPERFIRQPEPDTAPAEPAEEQTVAATGAVKPVCPRCGRRTYRESTMCADCRDVACGVKNWRLPPADRDLDAEARLWETIKRNLDEIPPLPWVPGRPEAPTCTTCGCLLASIDESCPACGLTWALAAEVKWLNRPTYDTTTTEQEPDHAQAARAVHPRITPHRSRGGRRDHREAVA